MFLQRWHREPSCAAREREAVEEKKKKKKREKKGGGGETRGNRKLMGK